MAQNKLTFSFTQFALGVFIASSLGSVVATNLPALMVAPDDPSAGYNGGESGGDGQVIPDPQNMYECVSQAIGTREQKFLDAFVEYNSAMETVYDNRRIGLMNAWLITNGPERNDSIAEVKSAFKSASKTIRTVRINATQAAIEQFKFEFAQCKEKFSKKSGNVFVTKDTTPIRSRQLLGGTLSDAVLRLNMTATVEDVEITKMRITVQGAGGESVDRLELFTDGAAEPFTTLASSCEDISMPDSSVHVFCNEFLNRKLIVPKNQDVKVLVRARMKHDTAGGVSGDLFIPGIQINGGFMAIEAKNANNNKVLTQNDGDTTAEGEVFIGTNEPKGNQAIVGTEHVTTLSKIISITNANPDANGTSVPTGTSAIGQFKFQAAEHQNSRNELNDVVLSAITFTVTARDVELEKNGFKIYNKSDATIRSDCEVVEPVAGNTTVTGNVLVQCRNLNFNTEIDSGSDAVFVLQGVITNPNTSYSSSVLQVSLQKFDRITYREFGLGENESHILWKDSDAGGGHEFTWIEYPETSVSSTLYQS